MGDLRFARRLAAAVLALAGALTATAAAPPAAAADGRTTIYAAASTTNAITDIITAFTAETGIAVTPSFASASTLAKQIEQGAPAEVFLSANSQWADYLADRNLVVEGSRRDLVGNRMVLIAPADSPLTAVDIAPGLDLPALLTGSRLAVGDPEHVPVGQYAKAALEHLGLWQTAEPALARQNDVRSALALVERGEAALGIVYATDAAVSTGVKVVGTFPADSHPPVSYPVVLVKDTPAARELLAFLQGPAAREIFVRYGFTVN